MQKETEVFNSAIEELFEIIEVEKGDVNTKILRQGCISVQTPNLTEGE